MSWPTVIRRNLSAARFWIFSSTRCGRISWPSASTSDVASGLCLADRAGPCNGLRGNCRRAKKLLSVSRTKPAFAGHRRLVGNIVPGGEQLLEPSVTHGRPIVPQKLQRRAIGADKAILVECQHAVSRSPEQVLAGMEA